MKNHSDIPRALRKAITQTLNHRQRKILKRRKRLAEQIKDFRNDQRVWMRGRGLVEVDNRFSHTGLKPIAQIIQQTMDQKGSCTVLEIGHGQGNLFRDLRSKQEPQQAPRLRLIGLDVGYFPGEGFQNKTGNLLTTPFPKADMIVSNWTLGYSGNIGFVIKKAAHALNPSGIALLHFNASGKGSFGENRLVIKDSDKLARQLAGLRFPNCVIKIFQQSRRGYKDLNVVLEKKE